MNFDDLLFAFIIAGIGLSGACLRAEYLAHHGRKDAERRKLANLRESHLHGITVSSCIALAMLTLACAPAPAAGEGAPPQDSLTPGMRVRIQVQDGSPREIIGTVKSLDVRSVAVEVPGRAEPVSLLREKITRLDVSEGSRSRGIDAAIGAAIGAAVGGAGGALADSGGSHHSHYVGSGEVAAVGALLGAGIGALLGVAIPPGERWKESAAARYRVGFAPQLDHGLKIALALSF
jgi:hypothetical protein